MTPRQARRERMNKARLALKEQIELDSKKEEGQKDGATDPEPIANTPSN